MASEVFSVEPCAMTGTSLFHSIHSGDDNSPIAKVKRMFSTQMNYRGKDLVQVVTPLLPGDYVLPTYDRSVYRHNVGESYYYDRFGRRIYR
jgi:hypothetical protein